MKVIVVANESEGAGLRHLVGQDVLLIPVASGSRAIEGRIISEFGVTEAALGHPKYPEAHQALVQSQIKSRRPQ